MRWSVAGAEAMLQQRAVCCNGDWDAFCQYRTAVEHDRLYPSTYQRAA
ncbi:MAG: hypothetical protein AB1505_36455 [Candidatus Latescibacterota bacterium]